MMRRHDVEGGETRHRLGMVERHPEPDARAAVVSRHAEALETEVVHHLDVVIRHGPEGIAGMVGSAVGFRGIAVAAQVGCDDREGFGQARCDLVPADMGQRVAVEEQERRPLPRKSDMDLRPARPDALDGSRASTRVRAAPAACEVRCGGRLDDLGIEVPNHALLHPSVRVNDPKRTEDCQQSIDRTGATPYEWSGSSRLPQRAAPGLR